MIFNLPSFGIGFASGFVSGVVARELTSVTSSALKPVARALVKTSVLTFERFRESIAHMGEAVEDIVAEVRAETGELPGTKIAQKDKKVSIQKRAAAEAGT